MSNNDKLPATSDQPTAKHTPGPWFYQENSDVYTHIVRPLSNTGLIICSLGQDSSGVAEATARLIAAAPEMLEACKEAVLSLSDAVDCYVDMPAMDKLKQVIAKAEGK